MRGCIGVARSPPLESGQGIVLSLRASDFDQRILRRTPARWLDPRRFAGLLLVVGRPRRISQPIALVALRQLEERRERARMQVDARVTIADAGEARRHGAEREVAGLAR